MDRAATVTFLTAQGSLPERLPPCHPLAHALQAPRLTRGGRVAWALGPAWDDAGSWEMAKQFCCHVHDPPPGPISSPPFQRGPPNSSGVSLLAFVLESVFLGEDSPTDGREVCEL